MIAASTYQRWMRILLCVVLVTLSLSEPAFSSSLFAWDVPAPRPEHNGLESISGLLSARGGSELRSLVNAKRILRDLSSSPSCAYQPTARLLRQCKVIKPKTEDSASDLQKANVQATYGISMALCEARQARVSVPSECRVFEDLLTYDIPAESVGISRASDIEGCMNSIFESSLWTSYTNFRIQSNDLCDSSRVDYQREELLETFRKATNVVPEVLAALKEHQTDSMNAVQNLQDLSADLSEAQEKMIASSNEQAAKAKEHLEQIARYVETYMQLMDESGKTWQTNLKEGVEQASQDLALMNNKASSMQNSFAELYAQAVEAMSGTTYNFENSVEAMTSGINEITRGLVDLDVDRSFDKLRQSLNLGQDAASHFAQTQKTQYEMTQHHLTLGKDLLTVIKDSHGHFHQIKETLDLFPNSWVEVLHQVHGTVSRFKVELKYSLVFLIPSLLSLLLGRVRMSAIIFLSYGLFRTTLSLTKTLQLDFMSMLVSADDLKLLFVCTFGAVCAGGSAACVGSFCLNAFKRHRGKPNAADIEQNVSCKPSSIEGAHRRDRRATIYTTDSIPAGDSSMQTLSRSRRRSLSPDSDRFVRSATVPFDFAPL